MTRDPARGAPDGMTGIDPTVATVENYRRFARVEAAGQSPAYEQLAYAVADDELILWFLDRLPAAKQQPNCSLLRRGICSALRPITTRCTRSSPGAQNSWPR